MLQLLHHRGEVNITAYVKHCYAQGVSLLKSPDELKFIYTILEESIKYGDTKMDAETINDFLHGGTQRRSSTVLKFPTSIHLQHKVHTAETQRFHSELEPIFFELMTNQQKFR